jgi:hypothetical protein
MVNDAVPDCVSLRVGILAVVVGLRVAVPVFVETAEIEEDPVLLGLAPTVSDGVPVPVLSAVLLGV